MSLCMNRLQEERRLWRKNHPFGFYAKPLKNVDGSMDLMNWELGIPGKVGTLWEGGLYPVTITFSEEYPTKPPKCRFVQGFYHPNVYPSGTICLSIINEDEDWRPAITLRQIALGIQELLDNPNLDSPAQSEAYTALRKDRAAYDRKVREQTKKYSK